MYNVSQNFLNTIKQNGRTFKSSITIRGTTFDDSSIIEMDLEENVNPAESFMLGGVGSAALTVTITNPPPTLIIEDAPVTAVISLLVNGEYEDVPLGVFTVDDIDIESNTVKITCYDNMMKLEQAYFSNLTYPASINAVAQEICTKAGVQLATALPNTQINKIDGYTYREAVGFIASFLGGFARFNRDGKLEITSYIDSGFSVDGNNYSKLTTNQNPFTIGRIVCKAGQVKDSDGNMVDNILTAGASGNEVSFENPIMTQAQLNSIYNSLKNLSYMPYSMDWSGNPALQAGDKITITDESNNVYNTLAMDSKFTYKGSISGTVSAVDQTETSQQFNSGGSMNNTVDRLVTEQANIKNALINKANIDDLSVYDGYIDNLKSTIANIGNLTATEGYIELLNSANANINNLLSSYATIDNLSASNARIKTLETDSESVTNLLAGNLSAENMQTEFITAESGLVANGAIKDAMILDCGIDKLKAGNISTNKFVVVSDSGNLKIQDNTLHVWDDNGQERISLGLNNGDYNLLVRGADGNTVLFGVDGVTKAGITTGAVDDSKVDVNANINAGKLDIDSLFSEMNGNSSTLKSSKIKFDDTGQTLDVAFNSLKNTVTDTANTVSSQGTSISAVRGDISSKIWSTDITSAVDNIDIGVRNLVGKFNANQAVDTVDSDSSKSKWGFILDNDEKSFSVNLKENQQYTASFVAWSESGEQNLHNNFEPDGLPLNDLNVDTIPKKYTWTFTTPESINFTQVDVRNWGRLFLNSPMIVTDNTDALYANSELPNPPVGGVFNNYNQAENRVLWGIDAPATCWTLIDLCTMYNISPSQDILDKINLIANFISTHLIDCNFYGSPFKAFPNLYTYDTISQAWVASTNIIHIRTFYHAIWALLEAYSITNTSSYLTATQELLDGVAIFSENIKQRITNKEIASYMYGALYNTINSSDGSSFEPDWITFCNTTIDVVYRSISKYINLFGNETRTNGEGISYSVQSMRDDYVNFLVNAYNNEGLRKLDGHNLLFGFYHFEWSDTPNSDGSYNPIAMNWDWNNDVWGQDQWFTGDLEFWTILGLALAGQSDIAKSLLDRFYALRAPDGQGRLLFYDRYDANGGHLPDDQSKSICFTGLYMQVRNILGDHSFDFECMSALEFYQVSSNNITIDGGYTWDATDSTAVIENKSLGEILFSIMKNLVIDICKFKFSNSLTGNKITVTDIQLQEGNKSTDYIDALEDINGQITSISQSYSILNQTLTEISGSVADIHTDIYNDGGVLSRLQSAETKITADSIVSTVTQSLTYIDSLGSEATSSQTSTIAQAADSIRIGFNKINSDLLTIDATNGLTIKGAGFTIKNAYNQAVLSEDSSGNLTMAGAFKSLQSDGTPAIIMDGTNIKFYDWGAGANHEIGIMFSSHDTDSYAAAGFEIAPNKGYKFSIGYQDTVADPTGNTYTNLLVMNNGAHTNDSNSGLTRLDIWNAQLWNCQLNYQKLFTGVSIAGGDHVDLNHGLHRVPLFTVLGTVGNINLTYAYVDINTIRIWNSSGNQWSGNVYFY